MNKATLRKLTSTVNDINCLTVCRYWKTYFHFVLKVILRLLILQPWNIGIACREMERIELLVFKILPWVDLVRDSSAVRRLFVRLAGAVGRQSALYKENSGFAVPTLGRHISTLCGYRILFFIRNPYINRFTNHFSINS
jgi:hypothetical protein